MWKEGNIKAPCQPKQGTQNCSYSPNLDPHVCVKQTHNDLLPLKYPEFLIGSYDDISVEGIKHIELDEKSTGQISSLWQCSSFALTEVSSQSDFQLSLAPTEINRASKRRAHPTTPTHQEVSSSHFQLEQQHRQSGQLSLNFSQLNNNSRWHIRIFFAVREI